MRKKQHSGFSLVELMFAMGVIAVGLGGLLVLYTSAINANSRNKMDSTALFVAEMVMERLASQPANANLPITIQDCAPAPNNWPITTASGGATLYGNDQGANISWSSEGYEGLQAGGYAMRYVACSGAGQRPVYEVRWNIRAVGAGGFTKLITVSARQVNTRDVVFPVNLRTISGI